MSKVITETLIAITDFLSRQFPDCEVRRTYMPNITIDKLPTGGNPRIIVSLYDRDINKPNRSEEYENIVTVDIMIVKKVKGNTEQEIDPLVDIVGEVFEMFCQTQTIAYNERTYRFAAIEHGDYREVCFEDYLNHGLFFGAMQLTVKTNRMRN
ncbi:MAG: hypothetical protein FWD31_08150 [Planctomycetaceae bacterium]|nr:hypothetical protein [Planctomycetaceae bacterium]